MENQSQYAFSVSVKTEYLADQSDVEENRYAFAYHITITNTGEVAAQLISRHWVIMDDNGEINEVRGLGVVGAQPLLQPNEQFQYSSGTLLNTPSGSMRGTYQVVAIDGTQFEADIEPFTLVVPRVLH